MTGLLPKSKDRNRVEDVFKYPGAWEFCDTLQASHTLDEMHESLTVVVEFPGLVMVKIEPHHLIPGMDELLARLEKHYPYCRDVPCLLTVYGASPS